MRAKTFFIFFIILTSITLQLSAQDTIKIGFSLGDAQSERWEKDKQYFQQLVNEMDGKVFFRTANQNFKEQYNQVLELLNLGINVLVVVASNSDSASLIVDVAHAKGVPVIAYDRLIKNCNLDYYISYDSYKVGELQAKYITNIKSNGNYMIIGGPLADFNSMLIKNGQHKVIDPLISKGLVNIILEKHMSAWNRAEAYTEVVNFLDSKNKKPDVILVGNDNMAQGVLEALDEFDLKGKVLVTGQDADLEACKEIINKKQTMTVYKPIKPLAFTAAMATMNIANKMPVVDALDVVNNGKIDVPSIILTPFIVDATNIKTNIIADGHLTEAELKAE